MSSKSIQHQGHLWLKWARSGAVGSIATAGVKYRVAWKSLITGFNGHGQWLPVSEVHSTVESSNRKFTGEIHHWVETSR